MIISQDIHTKMTHKLYRYVPPNIKNKPWSLKLFLLSVYMLMMAMLTIIFCLLFSHYLPLLPSNPNNYINIALLFLLILSVKLYLKNYVINVIFIVFNLKGLMFRVISPEQALPVPLMLPYV